jgi:hypothetical protein
MWAHLGMGYSLKNHNKDFSPYLEVKYVDPKWFEAVGAPVPEESRRQRELEATGENLMRK